ncbi:hypothetical protein ABK040_003576 [Willaertia magna]
MKRYLFNNHHLLLLSLLLLITTTIISLVIATNSNNNNYQHFANSDTDTLITRIDNINSIHHIANNKKQEQLTTTTIPQHFHTLYKINDNNQNTTTFLLKSIPITISLNGGIPECLPCKTKTQILYLEITNLEINFQYNLKNKNGQCPVEFIKNYNLLNYTDELAYFNDIYSKSPIFSIKDIINITNIDNNNIYIYGYLYKNNYKYNNIKCILLQKVENVKIFINLGNNNNCPFLDNVTKEVKMNDLNSGGSSITTCSITKDGFINEQIITITSNCMNLNYSFVMMLMTMVVMLFLDL